VPDDPITFIKNDDGGPTLEAPHTNGAVTTSGNAKARSIRRRLLLVGAVVFVGLWAFALTYSVTAGGRSPERLNDPNAHSVETACLDARHALQALPQVSTNASANAQAARITSEDAILTSMVARLAALHPEQKTPAVALTGWLADWRRLITARQHYARDLRSMGDAARFVEPATAGVDPIVDKMNNWILEQGTRTNACNTGQLQGEVVMGPRSYGPGSNT
jgi:hypothetical protein